MDKEEGDGWKKVKKGKATLKSKEKNNTGPIENPQSNPEAKDAPKEASTHSKVPRSQNLGKRIQRRWEKEIHIPIR